MAEIPHLASPMSSVEVAIPTYHQCHGCPKMNTKAERQTEMRLPVAADTTCSTFVYNIPFGTPLTRCPVRSVAMTANKLSANSHSIWSSEICCLPLSISNLVGEAGQYRVGIGIFWILSLVCNLRRDITALNHLNIIIHSGISDSTFKLISMRHGQTEFGA